MIGVQVLYSTSAVGTQILLTHDEGDIFVDVGDGALRDLVAKRYDFSCLMGAFITHEHVDHFSGLLALVNFLVQMGGRKDFLVVAPREMRRIKRLLGVPLLDSGLPFRLILREAVSGRSLHIGGLSVKPFKVSHTEASSLGYSVTDRGGFRVVISGDTRLCHNLRKNISGADIAVLECTFEDGQEHDAEILGHMTRREAEEMGSLAKHAVFIHQMDPYYYNRMDCRPRATSAKKRCPSSPLRG